jgi:hypothetical protein
VGVQLADSKCFEHWKFVSNNNKGTMALTANRSYLSLNHWSVNKEGQFILKVLDAGEKQKKGKRWLFVYL